MPTSPELTIEEVAAMMCRLEQKRKSRIWFDPDVDLLNALHAAERELFSVMGYLATESMADAD